MQKSKVIIGVVGVVVIGAALSLGYHNISQREQRFNEGMQRITKLLPPYLNHENIISKGLFSSTGVYKLNYVDAGKTDSIIVNYEVKHGVMSWFGADMKFHSTMKLEGEMAKKIQTSPTDTMVLDGVIKSDNSFDIKGRGSRVTILVDEKTNLGKIVIDESSSSMVYDDKSGDVKMAITYPVINVVSKDSMVLKGTEISRSFNMSAPSLGDFSFKLPEVAGKLFNIKGIDIYAKGLIEQNKLDIITSVKAQNITVPTLAQKDVALEVSYSLKGLDKSFLEMYKEISTEEGADISPEQKERLLARSNEILKTGGILSLDKFSLQNAKGSVDLSGALELKPVKKIEDISLYKNTKMTFDVLVKGEYAAMLTAMAPPTARALFTVDNKSVKSSAIFDNNTLSINGMEMPEAVVAELNARLEELDAQIEANWK